MTATTAEDRALGVSELPAAAGPSSRHSSEQDGNGFEKKGSSDDHAKDIEAGRATVTHEAQMEAVQSDIQTAIASHAFNDPLLDPELVIAAQQALAKGDEKAELALEDVLLEDSIYPEVRAAVSNVDDPELPVNTLRSWFLGILGAILLAAVNQFFIFQSPQIQITGIVAQLLAYPLGVAMAKIPYPSHWPLAWFINPGPFNIKEHTFITVMSTVSCANAYATDIIAVQKHYYEQDPGVAYQFLLVLSTQLIGFSYAGFVRKFLVWPAAMIWPQNLPVAALMNTLHKQQDTEPGTWSRGKMFTVVFAAAFVWEWCPGYLWTSLAYFSWPAWAAPENIPVNLIFGGSGGLGLGFLAFDWSVVTAWLLSPLMTPFFAIANIFAGYVLIICIVSPILFTQNVNYAAYLPFSSSKNFDRFGQRYQSTHILTNNVFDEAKYNSYSQQYLGATQQLAYGFGFAAITATLTHTVMFYGKDIVQQFKRSLSDQPDIHSRMMARYKEVPMWWYLATFAVSFAFAVPATVSLYPTELPVWALILSLILAAIYFLPVGIVQAVTASQIGLNIISELIIGYMLPGRPVAMMVFKTFAYITMSQGLYFAQDLKLGHYLKVPPRDMFIGQVVGTVIAAVTQIGVTDFLFGGFVTDICGEHPSPVRFSCAYQSVYYTASIVWGLIGPGRNFAAGQQYALLNILFLVGAIMPIPTYFLARKYPRSIFRLVSWPIIFNGIGYFPPATGANYTSWAFYGFIFQYVIRKRNFRFWSAYNYVISAALDSGTAITIIIVALALQYASGPNAPALVNVFYNDDGDVWWGNAVEGNTLQGSDAGIRLREIPPEGFAPAPDGQWHPNPFASA